MLENISLFSGLFHRIIAQGGTVIAPVADLEDPMSMGFRAGRRLGFQGTDPEKLVDFLKKQSAEDLCEVVYQVMDDVRQVKDKIKFLKQLNVQKTILIPPLAHISRQ